MADKIKIHLLRCGYVQVSPNLPFGNGNLIKASGFFEAEKEKIWLPVNAVYIEHPKAKILVDTGWNRAMSPDGVIDKEAQIRHLSYLLYKVNQGYVETGHTADEQLAKMGVAVEDLDYVVLSHLDCDHASGLSPFKGAKKILVSEDEMESATKFVNSHTRYTPRLWEGTGIETFKFAKTGLGRVGESYDLLGDGSIQFVHIPGHSKGLAATLISNNGKQALYFSDGGYATRSWKEMLLPGVCEDKEAARKSLEWIREISLSDSCIDSFACHDSEIAPHITEI